MAHLGYHEALNRHHVYRETRWDLKTGKRAGARVEISERQLYAAADPAEVFDYYMGWAARRIMDEIEKLGYTTHPDIVRAHTEWERFQDAALFTISLRGTFPPIHPVPGDTAHLENGPLAGGNIAVPDRITYTYEQITPVGADYVLEYDPVAFDTATGHWVYRTNDI